MRTNGFHILVFVGAMASGATAVAGVPVSMRQGAPQALTSGAVTDVRPDSIDGVPRAAPRKEWEFRDSCPRRDPRARRGTALDRFDIDELTLLGARPGKSALLVDKRGTRHIAQLCDFVGKYRGRVTEIRRTELIVTETIEDPHTGRRYPVYIPIKSRAFRLRPVINDMNLYDTRQPNRP